jgi:hypothetical protein
MENLPAKLTTSISGFPKSLQENGGIIYTYSPPPF